MLDTGYKNDLDPYFIQHPETRIQYLFVYYPKAIFKNQTHLLSFQSFKAVKAACTNGIVQAALSDVLIRQQVVVDGNLSKALELGFHVCGKIGRSKVGRNRAEFFLEFFTDPFKSFSMELMLECIGERKVQLSLGFNKIHGIITKRHQTLTIVTLIVMIGIGNYFKYNQ